MTVQIAIDIGGTIWRAAVFSEDIQKPIKVMCIPARDENTTLLERLQNRIAQVWPTDERVASIAVAAPDPTDQYRGILIEAPNIPGWVEYPLRSYLEYHFNVPVAFGNDANLAALGEWQFGDDAGLLGALALARTTSPG